MGTVHYTIFCIVLCTVHCTVHCTLHCTVHCILHWPLGYTEHPRSVTLPYEIPTHSLHDYTNQFQHSKFCSIQVIDNTVVYWLRRYPWNVAILGSSPAQILFSFSNSIESESFETSLDRTVRWRSQQSVKTE